MKAILKVLILIILEVTLWGVSSVIPVILALSLNPYYTGSYSMSELSHDVLNPARVRLNPYYTGSYSMSIFNVNKKWIMKKS